MTKRLKKALLDQKRSTEATKFKIYGTLGIPLGGVQVIEVPTRSQYVYVRLRTNQNETIQAFNNVVAPSYGLPVVLARQNGRYEVLEVDTVRYINNWNNSAPFLPSHGETHSFNDNGGGGDMVWVYSKQFMPLLVYPTGTYGGASVQISPHMMLDTAGLWHYVGNTGTPNLLQYVPSGTQALMALIYMDRNTGNPGILIGSGSLFSNQLTASSDIAPYIPTPLTNQIPLGAVKISTGTSAINWNYIYDVRQMYQYNSTGSSGGGGGGGGGLDTIGFAGLYNGVPLGTGTFLNVRSSTAIFTKSGSMFDLFITGSAGSTNPPISGTFVAQNQGTTLGSATTLNATAPLFLNISGSVAQILMSGTNSTYLRVGQPTSLSSVTGTYWTVPDRIYATGSLAVFNQGHDLIPGIDYAEQYANSGTFQYISTPPTGTYNLVIYGVPATGGGGSSGGGGGVTLDQTDPYQLLHLISGSNSDNDEFSTNTSANYTQVTPTGSITWTISNHVLSALFSGQSASDLCAFLKAMTLADGEWFETFIRSTVKATNFTMMGIVVTDGTSATSNACAVMAYYSNSTDLVTIEIWTGTLTNMTSGAVTYSEAASNVANGLRIRLKRNSSSSFEWAISTPDGAQWSKFGTSTVNPGFTPTHAGLIASVWGGAHTAIVSYDYIRHLTS